MLRSPARSARFPHDRIEKCFCTISRGTLVTAEAKSGFVADRRDVLKALAGGAVLAATSGAWRTASAGDDDKLAAAALRGGLTLITGAGGNVVLLTTPDGAVQVDSGTSTRSQDLAKLVAEHLGSTPTRTLFNTHWHLDHTGGNEAVAPSGTPIVAHENTRLWMSTKFYVEWEDRYYQRRPKAAWPNKTFFSSDPQPLFVDVGKSRVEYGHLPEAHTDGDIYVRFPEQNVIVAGGTVTAGRYPVLDYITGGWIGGLADATKKLIALCDADTRLHQSWCVVHTIPNHDNLAAFCDQGFDPVMCRNTNHPGKRLPSADDRSSKVSYKRPSEVTGAIRLQSTRDSLASQGAGRAVEQARIADNIYAAR